MIEYRVHDMNIAVYDFLNLVNAVWPGDYDEAKTAEALQNTINFTAYKDEQLIGCVRVLSDGYFFGTITEILVHPDYQRQGIGSQLMQLVAKHTPTRLYFGAQPETEAFYEKNGCQKSLQSYAIYKRRKGKGEA